MSAATDYDNDGIDMATTIDLNGGDNEVWFSVQMLSLTFTKPDNLGRVWINFREKIFSNL